MSAALASSAEDAFRPDYVAAADCALAFSRAVRTGWMTYGELEDRIVPMLAGLSYQRENVARREAASIIGKALDLWKS